MTTFWLLIAALVMVVVSILADVRAQRTRRGYSIAPVTAMIACALIVVAVAAAIAGQAAL